MGIIAHIRLMKPAPQNTPDADPTFDLIDSAGYGYRKVWDERVYLLRLCIIPFIVKFACIVLVAVFGHQTAFLRQGLIMIPSLFVEGWVLAQFLRTILMHERWPIAIPQTDNMAMLGPLFERARGIMASILGYVLIGMVAFVLKALAFSLIEMSNVETAGTPPGTPGTSPPAEGAAATNGLMFFPAVALIVFSIWAFRFLWLYIPLVVLMPVRDFLKKLGGFMTSVRMFAVWLICFTPFMFLLLLFSSALLGPYEGSIAAAPAFTGFLVILVSTAVELLVSLIAAAALAYALKELFTLKHPQAFREYLQQGQR